LIVAYGLQLCKSDRDQGDFGAVDARLDIVLQALGDAMTAREGRS
jgi:hypothetical protein